MGGRSRRGPAVPCAKRLPDMRENCIHCGRPRLEGIRLCEECARYLRLRRCGVPAATIVGMVDRYCNYVGDRFDRAGYRAALEALARDTRSG